MDSFIFFFLHNLANQSNFIDSVIIFFADALPYLVVIFTFFFLIFHHDLKFTSNSQKEIFRKIHESFFAFFVGLSAFLTSEVLKVIFSKLRPYKVYENVDNLFYSTGYAFPSGHSTFYMALAFSIYFLHKKVGMILIFCAFFIGVARVMAGVHYPIDILGGYVLGIIIAVFFNYLFKKE